MSFLTKEIHEKPNTDYKYKAANNFLAGVKAWSPRSNTLNTGLIFHFPDEKVRVKSIATQGKPSTDECVTEYFVQYSDDGDSWTNYVDSTGEIEVPVTLVGTTCSSYFL